MDYKSISLDTRKGNSIDNYQGCEITLKDKKTNEIVGQKILLKNKKNKLTRGYREASFDFDFTKLKIDKYSGLAELLAKREIIEKKKVKIEGMRGGPRNGFCYKDIDFLDADFGRLIEENGWLEEFDAALKEYDEANMEKDFEDFTETAED